MCLCVGGGLFVCLSLASDSLETVEAVIIKLGRVTASGLRMHHVLIVLTLTFIQAMKCMA